MGVAALVLLQFLLRAPARKLERASPAAAAIDTTPGITRVGQQKASQVWADFEKTPGVRKWSCSPPLCEVQFDPELWAQLDYDLKRNVTAALGIGLAFGKNARWTEVVDVMTGKKLAGYNTRTDVTKIE